MLTAIKISGIPVPCVPRKSTLQYMERNWFNPELHAWCDQNVCRLTYSAAIVISGIPVPRQSPLQCMDRNVLNPELLASVGVCSWCV